MAVLNPYVWYMYMCVRVDIWFLSGSKMKLGCVDAREKATLQLLSMNLSKNIQKMKVPSKDTL